MTIYYMMELPLVLGVICAPWKLHQLHNFLDMPVILIWFRILIHRFQILIWDVLSCCFFSRLEKISMIGSKHNLSSYFYMTYINTAPSPTLSFFKGFL